MHFPVKIIVFCALVATVLAVPAPNSIVQPAAVAAKHQKFESQLVFTIAGDTPAEVQESVRKARQIFEEINIDIIEGGSDGYGGYNREYNHRGHGGGYNNRGFGGFRETEIDVNLENFGK